MDGDSQTLSLKIMMDKEINKQKTSNFFAPSGAQSPTPSKLGMVIDVVLTILAPLKK